MRRLRLAAAVGLVGALTACGGLGLRTPATATCSVWLHDMGEAQRTQLVRPLLSQAFNDTGLEPMALTDEVLTGEVQTQVADIVTNACRPKLGAALVQPLVDGLLTQLIDGISRNDLSGCCEDFGPAGPPSNWSPGRRR